MPRQTDVSDIESEGRLFINTNEWENDEARNFYYTGYEKVSRLSKAGNQYTQYLIYLLPINEDGTFTEEMTLGVFPSQAQGLKKCGVNNFQELTITKTRPSQYEEYIFVVGKKTLPLKDRPEVIEYPDMNQTEVMQSRSENDQPSADEINIEDIPF